MMAHRIALHFRTRQKLPNDYAATLTEYKSDDVALVYGRSDGNYKVILNKGASGVMRLGDDHAAVKFVSVCEENSSSFSVFEKWLQNSQYFIVLLNH